MPEVIGIDHIYITVSDLTRSEAFYDHVLRDTLAFRKDAFLLDGEPHVQYFNRHFGFVLRAARDNAPYNPYSPGLHHFCLRVESVAEVSAVAHKLRSLGVEASGAKNYPEYAPDYWATFSVTRTEFGWRSLTTARSTKNAMTIGNPAAFPFNAVVL